MSKIAIFSDVHANLAALNNVISNALEKGVSKFVCLGDVVGYGPNPSDCITKIQQLNCICIKGNHDEYVTSQDDFKNFNEQAQLSLNWTKNQISEAQKSWLSNLPYTRRLGRNTLVHATLEEPEKWEYVRNRFDAAIAMKDQKTPICFYGHTHMPVSYEMTGHTVNKATESLIQLDEKAKYLINPGSVGQPRDGNSAASYIIFDRIERTISFERVEYDVQTVADEIISMGLPDSLAKRLITAS